MNVVQHPVFLAAETNTSFIDENPHLFALPPSRNRAQKILSYLANTMVNGPSTPLVTPYPPAKTDVVPPDAPVGEKRESHCWPHNVTVTNSVCLLTGKCFLSSK